MTVIYIRHGDDSEPDSKYLNDPGIRKGGHHKIKKLGKSLLLKHGPPDFILVSPMNRTIETCEVFEKLFAHRPKIMIAPELSRLFTSSERDPRTLRPRTLKLETPLKETRAEFNNRVEYHVEKMFKKKYYRRGPVVWCITHALVIKKIAEKFRFPIEHIEFLETFSVGGAPVRFRRENHRPIP